MITNCSEYSSKNKHRASGYSVINDCPFLPTLKILNTPFMTSSSHHLPFILQRKHSIPLGNCKHWLHPRRNSHVHPQYTFLKESNVKQLIFFTLGIWYRNSCSPDSEKQTTSLPLTHAIRSCVTQSSGKTLFLNLELLLFVHHKQAKV